MMTLPVKMMTRNESTFLVLSDYIEKNPPQFTERGFGIHDLITNKRALLNLPT